MSSLKFQVALFLIIAFLVLSLKDREYNVKIASITDSSGFLHEFTLIPDGQGMTSSSSATRKKQDVQELVVYTTESCITVYTKKKKYVFPDYTSVVIR